MKKIIVITRAFGKGIVEYENQHPFITTESKNLEGELFDFIASKLENNNSLGFYISDEFIDWFESIGTKVTYGTATEMDYKLTLGYLKNRNQYQIKSHESKIKESFIKVIDYCFYKKFPNVFIEYKEIERGTFTVYVLPCYNENYYREKLNYNASDKIELLNKIIKQFKLEEKEENQIYIHDTEWGSAIYDYNALFEVQNDDIKKYLKGGIYIYAHSPLSEYFCEVLKGFKDDISVFNRIHNINVKRNVLNNLDNPNNVTDNVEEGDKDAFNTYKALPLNSISLRDIADLAKAITYNP